MKSFVRLLVTAIALFAVTQASQAQTATQTINLNAMVDDYCTIAGSASGTPEDREIFVNTGIVDTAALTPVNIPNVVCSKASNVTLTSSNTGLIGPPVLTGFQNVIDYTAVATFGDATATLDTNAGATASDATTVAANGDLNVTITPQLNASPMAPGGYADLLTVTLTPLP